MQTVTVARRAAEAAKLPPKPAPAYQTANPPQDPTVAWKAEAETELLVALRDGDLLAQGRYTEERTHGWGHGGDSSGFGLLSGYHASIRPEQWREGKYSLGRLTARDWEFIDIRVGRFLVKAIWPDYIPEPVRPAQGAADAIYTTPYLDLMQAVIAQFGISAGNQGKKECLTDSVSRTAGRGRTCVQQACRRHGHADPAARRLSAAAQSGSFGPDPVGQAETTTGPRVPGGPSRRAGDGRFRGPQSALETAHGYPTERSFRRGDAAARARLCRGAGLSSRSSVWGTMRSRRGCRTVAEAAYRQRIALGEDGWTGSAPARSAITASTWPR